MAFYKEKSSAGSGSLRGQGRKERPIFGPRYFHKVVDARGLPAHTSCSPELHTVIAEGRYREPT